MPLKRSTRKSERRRKPRADANLSMRVEGAASETEDAQLVTESQNISSSGVYCTAGHFLAPMSKVALTIVLPRLPGSRGTKELIKCEGIVVRCEPQSARKSEKLYQLACMFSGLDDRRRQLLDEFVTWRNLQSLRAATAGAKNGTRRRVTPARRRVPATASRTAARSGSSRRTAH